VIGIKTLTPREHEVALLVKLPTTPNPPVGIFGSAPLRPILNIEVEAGQPGLLASGGLCLVALTRQMREDRVKKFLILIE